MMTWSIPGVNRDSKIPNTRLSNLGNVKGATWMALTQEFFGLEELKMWSSHYPCG
ncbi:MAG: hypothetical protein ACI9ZV_000114 [Candidatus Azotimanducaceae bacterium]|jgi:hypothetical protein